MRPTSGFYLSWRAAAEEGKPAGCGGLVWCENQVAVDETKLWLEERGARTYVQPLGTDREEYR